MTQLDILTVAERDLLAECESTIERGIRTFREVGEALLSVRDNKLYRAEHATFEDYCQQRWNLSRPRAYELMTASRVVSAIADTGLPSPANEGQARALSRVPEPERAEVWRETVDRTGGKPTAAAVAQTYAQRTAEPEQAADIPPQPDQCSAQVLVEKAMDEFLPPDPESPHRDWRIAFLSAMSPAYRLMSGFAVDAVAEHADEECLDELERLAAQVASYRDRVRAARPVPNNVRHLRAVS